MNKLKNQAKAASGSAWSENGLEHVGICPVCGEARRTLLYKALTDTIFKCAPGRWSMWRCSGCKSGYLDPRPTPETIHKAYEAYYTHATHETRRDINELGTALRIRRLLSNGYANWRYGSQRRPASSIGIALGVLCPPFTSIVDRAFRHLPSKPESDASILDIGCGNGEFLRTASEAGWRVMGIDPDPKAVAEAKRKGFAVKHGGTEVLSEVASAFDFISMSHVIEHVHNPLTVLTDCYRLLKPGGLLWIETPNIDSYGHSLLRKQWYPLDPPRHLVLFNNQSLRNILSTTGFTGFTTPCQQMECSSKISQSFAISLGKSLYDRCKAPIRLRSLGRLGDVWEMIVSTSHEAILITARKPLH